MKQFKVQPWAVAAMLAVGVSNTALATDRTVNPVMTGQGEWFVETTVSGAEAFLDGGSDLFMVLFPMGSGPDLNSATYNVNLGLFGEPATKFDSVTFSSAAGQAPVPAVKVGPFAFGQGSFLNVAGPFSLTVIGASTGGYTLRASFEEVSPVPELNTVALMLAGLLGIGFLSRRSLPR